MKNWFRFRSLLWLFCFLGCGSAGAADPKQDFVEPPLKFAPRPLWFWNNTTVTAEGIASQMQAAPKE